jgi:hypothetical protein
MLQKAEPRLVEVSSLPTFYIDNIARVHVHGPIVRVTCFEYRLIRDELVRMPNLEILRPLAADIPAELAEQIARARAEMALAPASLAHH